MFAPMRDDSPRSTLPAPDAAPSVSKWGGAKAVVEQVAASAPSSPQGTWETLNAGGGGTKERMEAVSYDVSTQGLKACTSRKLCSSFLACHIPLL